MSDSGTEGAFLKGFLLGGLVGATAALLLTPHSGEQTRLQIQAKGIELKTQVGDGVSALQEKGQVVIHEGFPSRDETVSEDTIETRLVAGVSSAASETAA